MSVQEYAQRLRNTRTFQFSSDSGGANGGINVQTGNFDCVIPPHPFPQDVIASRAIFKLISYYVVNQTAAQRASNSLVSDNSGFFVQINGAGFNQGILTQALSSDLST